MDINMDLVPVLLKFSRKKRAARAKFGVSSLSASPLLVNLLHFRSIAAKQYASSILDVFGLLHSEIHWSKDAEEASSLSASAEELQVPNTQLWDQDLKYLKKTINTIESNLRTQQGQFEEL